LRWGKDAALSRFFKRFLKIKKEGAHGMLSLVEALFILACTSHRKDMEEPKQSLGLTPARLTLLALTVLAILLRPWVLESFGTSTRLCFAFLCLCIFSLTKRNLKGTLALAVSLVLLMSLVHPLRVLDPFKAAAAAEAGRGKQVFQVLESREYSHDVKLFEKKNEKWKPQAGIWSLRRKAKDGLEAGDFFAVYEGGNRLFWPGYSRRNPGDALIRGERMGQLALQDRLLLKGLPPAQAWDPLAGWRVKLERRLKSECEHSWPILTAMLLGNREHLPEQMIEDFRRSGLAHLLAVSGMHVGLLAAGCLALLSFLPLSWHLRYLLLLPALLLYAALTGGSVSVLRAAGMGSLLIFSRLFERRLLLLEVLILSALIQLWLEPNQLMKPGFQLSYLAVAALALSVEVGSKFSRRLPKWALYFWKSLQASSQITLGSAAILLFHFGQLSLTGLWVNPLAIPLAGLLLMCGALQLLAPFPGRPFGHVADALYQCLEWVAHQSAQLDVGFIEMRLAPLQAVFLALVCWLLILPLARFRFRMLLTALLLVLVLDLIPRSQNQGLARLWMLDVGQGDSVLLQSPGGQLILFDAGWCHPSGGSNRGLDVVLPALKYFPAAPLRDLVLSHPDLDHIGGSAALIETGRVQRVWLNDERRDNAPFRRFEAALEKEELCVQSMRAGCILLSEANYRIYALGPPPVGVCSAGNERSVVLLVVHGDTRFLLTGDAGFEEEAWLARRYGSLLEAHVLKLGHHGAKKASSFPFLHLVKPELALASCGRFNRYGHPSPVMADRLAKVGVPFLSTAYQGAVCFESRGRGFRVRNPDAAVPWVGPLF
jgi:competence protein ComEC